MMPDLSRLYGDTFFAEWGAQNQHYVEGARLIADVLVREFHPERVVDMGCGCGVYGDWLGRRGVEVVSIDGVRPCAPYAFPVTILQRDITAPFENLWGAFDFCLCLEVAEHIPEPLSDMFLDNLIRFSDRVILSASPPGQRGHHHVNEQPKRYWVERMAARGYLYDRPATGRLMETFKRNKPPMMWMAEHISIYNKARRHADSHQMLPFQIQVIQLAGGMRGCREISDAVRDRRRTGTPRGVKKISPAQR